MSDGQRRSLIGLGVGVATAAGAAAVGVAADRLLRARGTAIALGTAQEYDDVPDEERVVMADDGVPLHVEIDHPQDRPAGAGPDDAVPTVVFSHGYTLNLRSWVFQRRALRAAGYPVVLWDQRGHGRSGTGERTSYDVDQLGRDLARVIEEAVPEGPIVLVGHSMGGMTMMALAVDHHELIRKRCVGAAFIATSPGGLADVSWGLGKLLGKVIHRVGPQAVDRLSSRQALIDSARRAGRDVEEFFVNRYSFASPVPLAVVRLTADMIFGTSMDVIAAFMPSLEGHDKREALAQFHGTEVLVLNGSGDLLTPPEHSEEIVRLVPGAEHVVLNDAGHIVMLEHPELVNEQLLELLERARRGQAGPRDGTPAPRVRSTITDLAKRRRDRRASRSVRRVPDVQRGRARQVGHGATGERAGRRGRGNPSGRPGSSRG